MAREICKLSLTVTDTGGSTEAQGSISFDGDGEDMVVVLAHIFDILEICPADVPMFCAVAVAQMVVNEEDELDGCDE